MVYVFFLYYKVGLDLILYIVIDLGEVILFDFYLQVYIQCKYVIKIFFNLIKSMFLIYILLGFIIILFIVEFYVIKFLLELM